ncbi:MAG: CHAD domain-containing protein [Anaerolineae bacterium]
MEIEAKFALTSQAFDRLIEADRIAEYSVGQARTVRVRDTYLDTSQQRLLAAGYACRRRIREGRSDLLITLKGMGDTEGAVHRREELETLLDADQPPEAWPSGAARDRVLQIAGDSALRPIADVHQTRITKEVTQGERQVAELSLDEWTLVGEGEAQTFFEAEVELLPLGTEEELAAIAAYMEHEWDLVPETRSKFERALSLLQQAQDQGQLLTPRQRAVCLQVAQRDDMYGRRARALLALDEGATQEEAGLQADLSERRVRYWLSAFRERQLGVLSPRVLAEAIGEAASPGTEAPLAPAETVVQAAPTAEAEQEEAAPSSRQPGLEADDLMIEAAHKVLYYHYRQMLRHEAGTRAGEDIEELHDMRVATRRMRAAFGVFADYISSETTAPYLKGLKRTGRKLGAVRDLDVFWEKTEHYLQGLSIGREMDLDPLHVVWQRERDRARDKMIAYLDSARYERFRERFGTYLQSPQAGGVPISTSGIEPRPHRLRFVAPLLIYQRLAAVQAYEGWVTGPDVPLERLHALRIAAKGLRYTFEFFEEVLGSEAHVLIEQIKELQDHLGDLHDAVVASNLLRDFLTWGTWGRDSSGKRAPYPREPIVAPGVAAYLAARQAELQELINTFPEAWARIQAHDFRERVAAAISVL